MSHTIGISSNKLVKWTSTLEKITVKYMYKGNLGKFLSLNYCVTEPILNRAAKRKLKKKIKRKQNKLIKEAGENTTDLCSTSRTALIAAQLGPPSPPQEGIGQSKQPSTPLLTSTPVLSR